MGKEHLVAMLRYVLAVALVVAVVGGAANVEGGEAESRAKLIVSIVVDGLRFDSLHAVEDRLCPGGFRMLFDRGVEYRQAHYRHSNTFTAVGHATLFTGAYSPRHGIVGNYWFGGEDGGRVYAVADSTCPIIERADERDAGRSPRNMLATTVGDELILGSGRRSRVFSIAGKDRAAILSGGHLGESYWYDSRSGHMVTSTYYRKEYPDWVEKWNGKGVAESYRDAEWRPLLEAEKYVHQEDGRVGEKGYRCLDSTFPHRPNGDKGDRFYDVLRYTPFSDEVLLAFAKELVEKEGLGKDEHADLLAISFSAMDYIQHAWGCRSLEAEDNLLRMDRTLAELFEFLDEVVGLDNVMFVLTADHGFDDIPEQWQLAGLGGGRQYPAELVSAANRALKERFNTQEDLVLAFWPPSVYLDTKTVGRLGLEVEEVERVLAEALLRLPGIAYAATRSDLMAGRLPADEVFSRVGNAFHPERSGSVIVVQSQFWYAYTSPDEDSATHGSPYHYDTHVPLIVVVPGGKGRAVQRVVGPEQIAPTISAHLGIAAPSAAGRDVLYEVLGQ